MLVRDQYQRASSTELKDVLINLEQMTKNGNINDKVN